MAGALKLARQVCEDSPCAIGESLSVMQDVLDADVALGWSQTELATEAILASEDRQEGLAVFLDKHSPEWRGR